MSCRSWLFLLFFFLIGISATAQKIVYSMPDKDDNRRMDFEIAGKVDGNFLIYKNTRNKNWIAVLNNDMEQIAKVEQEYVPDNDRMINTDFFSYGDFCYMIYQYQKRNVVYCMASKIDGSGKKVGDVVELDTTHIGFAANNRVYSVMTSEDKSKIIVFKINSRNKRMFIMTTLLWNDKLSLLKKSRIQIPMEENNEYLSDFQIDNDGNLVFSKFSRHNNDNISGGAFVIKYADADTLMMSNLNIDKTNLDEIHIKVDNFNKRYFLTSFYYKEKRGNIAGFYFYVWDQTTARPITENTLVLGDELRKDAKGDANIKMAFNDYFIRNIIIRRDGGFIISSESYYTSSRYNNWNRWDYLYGSPYYSSFDNYYYSPYYSNYWWGNRYNNQSVRYHADNIVILSFDKNGKLEWNNVLAKEQFDDQTDDLISFQLMNTGGQIHFLFNQLERRSNLLNDYSVSPSGQMVHNPTLKNLDKGYEFMPKYGKQVSARQMIIPCQYHNELCFAKIEYN